MDAFKTISISVKEAELLRAHGVGCPPQATCGTYPCCHTPCLDSDYLHNLWDKTFNLKHCRKVWRLWHHPESRNSIPDSEREEYETKFDRCQRISEKIHQIRREIDLHQVRMLGLDKSLVDPNDYGPFPEIEEATRAQLEELRSRKKTEVILEL